jgi:hypothetical protein
MAGRAAADPSLTNPRFAPAKPLFPARYGRDPPDSGCAPPVLFSDGSDDHAGRNRQDRRPGGTRRRRSRATTRRRSPRSPEIGPHLRTDTGRPHTSTGAQEVSVAPLEKLLSEGQTSGEFRDFDVRSTAVIARGTIDAAARRLREEPGFSFPAYPGEVVTNFVLATRREA